MSLTRVKMVKINGKLEIVEKQTGIHDDNPIIYYGNEDQPIEIDDNIKPITFEEFKEYLKKKDEPLTIEKSEDPNVSISIRIPRSYATGLRATGRGWQTRVGEYLVNGIKRGDLGGKGDILNKKTKLK